MIQQEENQSEKKIQENEDIKNLSEKSQKTEVADLEKEKKEDSLQNINLMSNKELLKDFHWDRIGKYEDDEIVSKEKEELTEVYESTLNNVENEQILEGTIVGLTKREVVINLNIKSEGIISRSEVRYNPDIKVGDKLEVFIVEREDKQERLILSHQKARVLKAWDKINELLETQEIVKGLIKCRTRGGLIVDIYGIESFLPGSQIDVRPIKDFDIYVGKTMEFKVVKINKEFKNIVVSHKVLIEQELEQQKVEIISKLEKGQILEGTVKNMTNYGVFVDLGGVDGLIHITDLSWGRINHPDEVLEINEKLRVVILDFDDNKKRIALGVKQLDADPWDNLDNSINEGSVAKVKVVVVADYGAFVEIIPGVEGLIHVSEISWSNNLKPAQEFFKVGDEIEAKILSFNKEEKKISLGIKQLKPDPWQNIEEKYVKGTKHNGQVTNLSDFGVFVELEEGINGLIHISEISWEKKIKHPSEVTSVGDEIEFLILDIDKENRRLSLGVKQLEENPWEVFESVFVEGTDHEGTVSKVTPRGMAVVTLQYGIEGIVAKKFAVKEDGSLLAKDDKLMFRVIEFNKYEKKIILSHLHIHQEIKERDKAEKHAKKKATSKAVMDVNKDSQKTTLGDIDALSSLKEHLKKEESKNKEKKSK